MDSKDVLTWLGAGPVGVLVGLFIKWVVDIWAARVRRVHEREMRLLDTAVESAVRFLVACDQLTRWAKRMSVVTRNLESLAPHVSDEGNPIWDHNQAVFREQDMHREQADQDANSTLTTLYLLVPGTGSVARAYLKACQAAVDGDDPNREERWRLRRETEVMLREHLGRAIAVDVE